MEFLHALQEAEDSQVPRAESDGVWGSIQAASGGTQQNSLDMPDTIDCHSISDSTSHHTSCSGSRCATKKKASTCLGCGRHPRAKCVARPDREMRWGYPNDRGSWCHPCLAVWRTSHQSNMSLAVYGDELLKNAESYELHQVQLLAWLSLDVERDGDNITGAMITSRVEVLKFVSGLLGWPLSQSAVHLLSDMEASGTLTTTPLLHLAKGLMTVKTSTGPMLGVVLPDTCEPPDSMVEKPTVERYIPFRAHVQCSPADRAILERRVTGSQGTVQVSTCTDLALKTNLAIDQSPPAATKLQNSARKTVRAVGVLMARFADADWTQLKESAFTKPLGACLALRQTATDQGDAETCDILSTWIAIASACKRCMASHRECVQSKHEVSQGAHHDSRLRGSAHVLGGEQHSCAPFVLRFSS